VTSEPADRAFEERHRALLTLVGEDLAVGQARGVVDADMHGLPAGAALAVTPVAGDAMADRRDASQLLRIDVEQLARSGALVAHDRRPGLERGQLAEPEAAGRMPRVTPKSQSQVNALGPSPPWSEQLPMLPISGLC